MLKHESVQKKKKIAIQVLKLDFVYFYRTHHPIYLQGLHCSLSLGTIIEKISLNKSSKLKSLRLRIISPGILNLLGGTEF